METVFDFWKDFGDGTKFIEVDTVSDTSSLAVDVLTYYGIPNKGTEGGSLNPLDIKHMDALAVIKMSLVEHSALKTGIWEIIVTEEGEVAFINIGSFNGLDQCTVYHQIQSSTFVEKCSGVMITGAKPLVTRKPVEWKNVWDVGGWKEIFHTSWLSENCLSNKYSQYAIIVFQDPHIVDSGNEHKDGIDNLYETKSYWENILGYARYITWEGAKASPDTTVTKESNSIIPILVSGEENSTSYKAGLGTLKQRPAMPTAIGVSPDCFSNKAGDAPSHTGGIKIDIPDKFRYETVRKTKVDKLVSIANIIVVGRKIDNLKGIPASDFDAVVDFPKDENAKIEISVNESSDGMFKLEEGVHYVIAYESSTEGSIPYVVFAENSREFEPADFGNDLTVKVSHDCGLYKEHGTTSLENVSILPTGGSDGYLVKQIIALVEVQTPCIKVYDPRSSEGEFGKAYEIANKLQYKLAALVSVEEPAPMAFNGSVIDMEEMQVDHDPTTEQDFKSTDIEKAMDKMAGGGGVSLTLSFLDEDGCKKLSSELYDYINAGNGSIVTYVCSPDSEPKLGGVAFDSVSIVNEIVYSYADSNSYTISVSAGERIVGDPISVTGGSSPKRVQDVPASGTVVEDLGNHIHFKVLLDGYSSSPLLAINTAPAVVRVGDKVQCTIYNNAVEQ